MRKFIYIFVFTALLSYTAYADNSRSIPILCYHNLNPTKPGSMNLTPAKFQAQLQWLKDHGFTIISLKEAVEYLQNVRASLPSKAIVITADDGWQSVYTYMYPIIKKLNVPVTLFIYPQTISQGKNAMTWNELKELQQTGLFDIQSHTYSHPNFKQEHKRLSDATYAVFVDKELSKSKQILEDKLGVKITYLAWPFGIYNDYLEQAAAKAGYKIAFTIDALPANKSFRSMAEPRYMIIDALSAKTFAAIANGAK